MLTFAAAIFFLMITPGPGVLSAAGVGAGFGAGPGTRYVVGLFIGNFLVGLAVVSGLAALILAQPILRSVLFALSVSYLLYLAVRIAFAGAKIGFAERASAPGIWGGTLLQLINPKAYAVNTVLFTGFNFWPASASTEIILKFLILNAIWIPIHFVWLGAGIALKRMALADHVQARVNYAMAASLLIVVGLAVWAQLTGV